MPRQPCRWCGGTMEKAERAARYCSDNCKDEYRIAHASPRQRTGRPCRVKKVDPKWLVRGNISDSSYRYVMDNS